MDPFVDFFFLFPTTVSKPALKYNPSSNQAVSFDATINGSITLPAGINMSSVKFIKNSSTNTYSITFDNFSGKIDNIPTTVNCITFGTTAFSINFNNGLSIATPGNKLVIGSDLSEIIPYSAGSNIFNAGKGNDTINGSGQNDIYIYNKGDGFDTINDFGGNDKILFGSGIAKKDLFFSKTGNDLLLNFVKSDGSLLSSDGISNDGILIKDHFANNNNKIETIQFADGSSYNISNIINNGDYFTLMASTTVSCSSGGGDNIVYGNTLDNTIDGGKGSDILYGNDGNDTLLGGAGDDTLYGGNGNDSLAGGTGNDTLYGGAGDDHYNFNKGDGQDTIIDNSGTNKIVFGKSLSKNDIILSKQTNDLKISFVNNTSDAVFIKNYFTDRNTISTISFTNSNGTISDFAASSFFNSNDGTTLAGGASANSLIGGDGVDIINGNGGNDAFTGGRGNDTLNGGSGNDSYYFYQGDGLDKITDSGGTDKIIFGRGISAKNVNYYRVGNDMIVKYGDNDEITVKNQYLEATNKVETVQFADGSSVALSSILARNTTLDSSGKVNTSATSAVYSFNKNDGTEKIIDAKGAFSSDALQFGAGITKDNLLFSQSGKDLVIQFKFIDVTGKEITSSTDKITIPDFYQGYYQNAVPLLKFADGDVINIIGLKANGTIGTNDINDVIFGKSGNDTLDGGKGYDDLYGGKGDDTYVYTLNKGFSATSVNYFDKTGNNGIDTIYDSGGNDTILLKASNNSTEITPDKLFFTKNGNDFKISFLQNDGTIDTVNGINIRNYFVSTDNKIENIKLNDGTIFKISDLSSSGLTLSGTTKDDLIYGSMGNDTINGSVGNDKLYGGVGNDILIGGLGKDQLYGGIGDDKFKYVNTDESNHAKGIDTIIDFVRGHDKIDVSTINDASGNTIFHSISDFTISYNDNTDITKIIAKASGVDFVIDLQGNFTGDATLTNADFVFAS